MIWIIIISVLPIVLIAFLSKYIVTKDMNKVYSKRKVVKLLRRHLKKLGELDRGLKRNVEMGSGTESGYFSVKHIANLERLLNAIESKELFAKTYYHMNPLDENEQNLVKKYRFIYNRYLYERRFIRCPECDAKLVYNNKIYDNHVRCLNFPECSFKGNEKDHSLYTWKREARGNYGKKYFHYSLSANNRR